MKTGRKVFLGLTGTALATYAGYRILKPGELPAQESLVLHYPIWQRPFHGGKLLDQSPSGIDAIVHNADWVEGEDGWILMFQGDLQNPGQMGYHAWVEVPDNEALRLSEYTVGLWLHPFSLFWPGNNIIWRRADSGWNILAADNAAAGGDVIYSNYSYPPEGGWVDLTQIWVPIGEWFHYGFTVHKENDHYITGAWYNGELQLEKDMGGKPPRTQFGSGYIGGGKEGLYYWVGFMDDITAFDRRLEDGEMKQLATYHKPPQPIGP